MTKTLDLEEVQELKKQTEKIISEAISEFMDKTGLTIEEVNVSYKQFAVNSNIPSIRSTYVSLRVLL